MPSDSPDADVGDGGGAPGSVRLGEQLASRRLELGLTQEQLALRVGISRNQLQNIERGYSFRKDRTPANPVLSTLVGFCRELNLVARIDVGDSGDFEILLSPVHGHRTSADAELNRRQPGPSGRYGS